MQVWHPFSQPAFDAAPITIARAKGVYLYTPDGRRILDAISSWWVNLHGHAHPLIAEAVAEQARKLEHAIFAGFTHQPAEELAARMGHLLPADLDHVFFSDNGSTAVEIALKLATQYWRNAGQPAKQRIIALEHAYHGDTIGAMSAGADSVFNEAFTSLRLPFWRAHSAYCFRCPVGKTRPSCVIDCVNHLAGQLDRYHHEAAAVIVEPLLQGAGGMIVHPIEFLQRVRQLCTQYDVLLIADEVLTGFGRTGRMFACDLAGIVPDMMCLSKGLTGGFLPLAATVCTPRIHREFAGTDRKRAFFHGHSYSGNPLGCAAANASLRIFESEPVFDRIGVITRIQRARLERLREHPAVADTRQIGTVAALELKTEDPGYLSRLRSFLYDFFLARDLLLRPLGNVVYVLPPYVIKPDELEHVYDVIEEALQNLPPPSSNAVSRACNAPRSKSAGATF